jgi:YVTN family beta-propeller protein
LVERSIKIIFLILLTIAAASCIAILNNTDAEVDFNTLESIANKTNVLESSQVTVGKHPTSLSGSIDYMYVANSGSDTISVIDSTTNMHNITVAKRPIYISSGGNAGYVYVANSGSNTVSVINSTTNTVKTNIQVGKNPNYIFDNDELNVIYVVNQDSDTVSVINRETNKVLAGVTLDINPG